MCNTVSRHVLGVKYIDVIPDDTKDHPERLLKAFLGMIEMVSNPFPVMIMVDQ